MNIFHKYVKYINGDFMRIKEVVNKNIIIGDVKDSIVEIATIMKKNNIGFLPIKNDKKIIGVITDRDIVINCISNNCNNNDSVEGYINKNIIHIDWNREITDALNIMAREKIKRILVSNNMKLVGILSLSDIITKEEKKTVETIKTIWELKDNDRNIEPEVDEYYL